MSTCVCAGDGAGLLRCWRCVVGAMCAMDQSKVLQGEVEDGGVRADPVGGAMDR